MKLMTQYDFEVTQDSDGVRVTLTDLQSGKNKKFFVKNGNTTADRVSSHMTTLTDTLCEQWFDEELSVEERKAKQKLRKEAARKEREELEARAKAVQEEAAKKKAEQKALEKAKKNARS